MYKTLLASHKEDAGIRLQSLGWVIQMHEHFTDSSATTPSYWNVEMNGERGPASLPHYGKRKTRFPQRAPPLDGMATKTIALAIFTTQFKS